MPVITGRQDRKADEVARANRVKWGVKPYTMVRTLGYLSASGSRVVGCRGLSRGASVCFAMNFAMNFAVERSARGN